MTDVFLKSFDSSERITQGHGSGGSDSAALMREIFGRHFSNEILDRLDDGAKLPEDIVVSTDTFVVSPLIFPGGDIGRLSVCGTLNDVLMMGAFPRYLSCAFVLEEGLEISLLEKIVLSMAATADAAGVKIVAGDTKVIEGNSGLLINTTGIGFPAKSSLDISAGNARPGDSVILSGTLGDHHACILSARMGINNDIKSDCAVLDDLCSSIISSSDNIHVLRDVTRGGLATVLNEIAAASSNSFSGNSDSGNSDSGSSDTPPSIQIKIDETKIPVAPPVKAFCGVMGLDPLFMGNEGKLVCIVPEVDSELVLESMRLNEFGRDAQIIGTVTEASSSEPPVVLKTRLGVMRRLSMLVGEGLPRIC